MEGGSSKEDVPTTQSRKRPRPGSRLNTLAFKARVQSLWHLFEEHRLRRQFAGDIIAQNSDTSLHSFAANSLKVLQSFPLQMTRLNALSLIEELLDKEIPGWDLEQNQGWILRPNDKSRLVTLEPPKT